MSSLYPQPTLLNASAYRNLRVGLFGGSFNPAHRAHRQLARRALMTLKLDVVWWLVSPQNPLKSADDMAPLAGRLMSAERQIGRAPHMLITDIEARMGTRYTADTIAKLQQRFPYTQFIWMMGADSFREFHKWENWRGIARRVPMAVFARPPQQLRSLSGFAARTLRQCRIRRPAELALRSRSGEAAWSYVMMPLNPISATEIRKANGRN